MTSIEIKKAKTAAAKPGKVTTSKLTKAQLAERRKAAGLKPLTAAQKNAAIAKVADEVSKNTTLKASAKKGNTPKGASQRDALRTSVVKAWNASKIADASKRRKAIATKLDCRGQVLGLLREAGIDGKSV
jgi:hypothetical protein